MARNRRIPVRGFAGGIIAPEMFGRPEDAKYQLGAQDLQNLLVKPQGAAVRRPGFQLTNRVASGTLASRLFPFVFSDDQSLMLEASTQIVDSRYTTYFRFFRDGTPVFYDLPGTFKGPWQFDDSDVSLANDWVLIGAGIPDLQTGDPVCFTFEPNATADAVTIGSSGGLIQIGSLPATPEGGAAITFFNTGGTLGYGLVPYKIYYIKSPSGTTANISESPFGPALTTTTSAPSGTHYACTSGTYQLDPLRRYYAIVLTPAMTGVGEYGVRFARSVSDALAGIYITFDAQSSFGPAGSLRSKIHYAYDISDHVRDGSGNAYYCTRPLYNDTAERVYPNNHADRIPASGPGATGYNYWTKVSGVYASGVTFTGSNAVWPGVVPFEVGDPVVFSNTGGALPASLTAGVRYYVVAVSGTSFQVATSRTGEPIAYAGPGTGTHAAWADHYYEVPTFYPSASLFDLTYVQSNDVLTLASRDRPVAELRRYADNDWDFVEVEFGSSARPPGYVYLSEAFAGEGIKVTQTNTAAHGTLTVSLTLGAALAVGETVYISGLDGTPGLPDGFYTVFNPTGATFQLKYLESGEPVPTSAAAGLDGRVRSSPASVDITNTYVVTAIDANGVESEPGAELEVTNNLFVPGAYTDIAWVASPNATRYRIYKKSIGLFGFIGETDGELTFRDDNIGPDLSIAPPIRDDELRVTAIEGEVSFDGTVAPGVVRKAAHGLQDGDPVVFRTNGNITGAGLWPDLTYIVSNASNNTFELKDLDGNQVTVLTPGGTPGQHYLVGGKFPGAVGYFEQRRVFAGGRTQPQGIRLTSSSTESDMSYSLPTIDSDRIFAILSVRRRNEIRHVLPLSQLVLLGESAEVRVTPVNDDALTPSSIGVRPQSYIGSSTVTPEIVNATAVFVAARGGHVRELGYSDTIAGYVTGDLSLRATNLFDELDIRQIAYQKAPYPVIWAVSTSGELLAMTYVPEENIGAWTRHVMDGVIESVACVPEGDEDIVYAVVLREGRRYVVRMAPQAVVDIEDCAYSDLGYSYSGSAVTTLRGLDHLNGETVAYLADGAAGTATIANGQLNITPAASDIHVGLPYTSTLVTMPITAQIDALGFGREWNPGLVHVRVVESGPFSVGPGAANLNAARYTAGVLQSQIVQVRAPGSWTDTGEVRVTTASPLPLKVVSLVVEATAGG